jgi:hypothetical protein
MPIPFLNNLHHLHNTFSTAAIPIAGIVAGIGYAVYLSSSAEDAQRLRISVVFVLLVLLCCYLIWMVGQPHTIDSTSFLGVTTLLFAVTYAWLVIIRAKDLDAATIGLLAFILAITLGRGALWGATPFDKYVVNPPLRESLVVTSPTIEAVTAGQMAEPRRVIGMGSAMFLGYSSVYGLEALDGPDPFFVKRYDELIEWLGVE